MSVLLYIYVGMCVPLHLCIYLSLCACLKECMYVCMCVCVLREGSCFSCVYVSAVRAPEG